MRCLLGLGMFLLSFLMAVSAEDAPAPPPAVETVAVDYRLYPGDVLVIEVYDHPDLQRTLRVPDAGGFVFPLIGEVTPVRDRTVGDLAREIRERLERDYLRTADVSLGIKEFGPRFAYVLGAVKLPAPVSLGHFGSLTALQAISEAGGFTAEADRSKAAVIRNAPGAGEEKISLPLPASDDPVAITSDIRLLPGDLVVVPAKDRVYLIGQVVSPGPVAISGQSALTVSKAVSMAGGFTRFARQHAVQVIRAGKPVITVDVRAVLVGARDAQDPVVEPGDTIFIPESRL